MRFNAEKEGSGDMKMGKTWFYGCITVSVAMVMTVGAPLRANMDKKHSCQKRWTITFPAGQGSPLHCAEFEDGSQRCSPDALEMPSACGNPSLRENLLILRP
jgi:hypothetical protein